jgi:ABC-type multidrug transport system ATPase subunit
MISLNNKDVILPNNLKLSFNLKLQSDELSVLYGENGSGKTTFLNHLKINKDYYFKKNFNVIFLDQKPINPFGDYRAYDLINNLNALYKGNTKCFSLNKNALEFLGMEKALKTPIRMLSGGENQKLKVLISLSMNATFFIFDEPTNNMDDKSKKYFWKYINELKQQGALIIEPDLNQVKVKYSKLYCLKKNNDEVVISLKLK